MNRLRNKLLSNSPVVYVSDKETHNLYKTLGKTKVFEIPNEIIKNNQNYLLWMSDVIKATDKKAIFISINPEHIDIASKSNFETLFLNTGYNDTCNIDPTYEINVYKEKVLIK